MQFKFLTILTAALSVQAVSVPLDALKNIQSATSIAGQTTPIVDNLGPASSILNLLKVLGNLSQIATQINTASTKIGGSSDIPTASQANICQAIDQFSTAQNVLTNAIGNNTGPFGILITPILAIFSVILDVIETFSGNVGNSLPICSVDAQQALSTVESTLGGVINQGK